MLRKSIVLAGSITIVALLALGCSGGGTDPITPDGPSRSIGDFEDPWNIFGLNLDELEDPADTQWVAQEVDLTPIVFDNTMTGQEGDLLTDSEDNSFVLAVSRVDALVLGEVIESFIELKMFSMRDYPGSPGEDLSPVMYDLKGGEFWGPVYSNEFNRIPGRYVNYVNDDSGCTPRVIARASQDQDEAEFEVIVAYVQRDVSNPDEIVLYRGLFTISDLTDSSLDVDLDSQDWDRIEPEDTEEYKFPDLAFGPISGNIHLVYNFYDESEPRDARIIHQQASGWDSWENRTWINYDDNGDNGWIPRIDVGTVTDPYNFTTTGDVMTVAVVYTRQECSPPPPQNYYGYRPYVRYWNEADGPGDITDDDSFQLPIVNGNYEPGPNGVYCGSGVPVIDISPESDDNHDAFVAYVQQVEGLPNPIRHNVFFAAQPFQGFVRVSRLADDGVLPSICIHPDEDELSITYYKQVTSGREWEVFANRVDCITQTVRGETQIDIEALGSFNIAELQDYNFSTASDISSTLHNGHPAYFAAWSDAVGIVCKPCHIQATFGHTVPY